MSWAIFAAARARSIAFVLLAMGTPDIASAAVERYAVIAGNNVGAGDEPTLRFAEDDAAKLADVLAELGGIPRENLVLLRGGDANELRRALIAVNDRIRGRVGEPGVEPLLLVYYSGHADARALHLGKSELELSELEQLVRGSAAGYRLLLLDACRSGALTQVKGGSSTLPFPVAITQELDGEGVIFLTSSSANEDAQESDQLKGSFFTHHLVSALLGAADTNGDGRIALREAYAYAYENTLRSSSRSLIGTQHPTFNYEIRGRADLVLTELKSDLRRAVMIFEQGESFLVLRDSETGAVVAEVTPSEHERQLSVRPGQYFLRSRGRDHLLEGTLLLGPGEKRRIAQEPLQRIEYARLVRKGAVPLSLVHGPSFGYQLRTPLWAGASACHGGFVGYGFDFLAVSVAPRIGACRSRFDNESLSASADEIDLSISLTHSFDLSFVSLSLGLGTGAALLLQSFQTSGEAPDRMTLAGELFASAAASFELGAGIQLVAEAAAISYLFEQEDGPDQVALAPHLAARFGFSAGKRF